MIYLEWILQPAAQLVLLALGLSLCLYLFVTVKSEIHALDAHRQQSEGALAAGVAAVRSDLDEVRAQTCRIEEQTGMLVPPAPATSGLNLSKRGQALQLYRRGQTSPQIAAALSLPLAEVDLLLKVHRMALEQAGN